ARTGRRPDRRGGPHRPVTGGPVLLPQHAAELAPEGRRVRCAEGRRVHGRGPAPLRRRDDRLAVDATFMWFERLLREGGGGCSARPFDRVATSHSSRSSSLRSSWLLA